MAKIKILETIRQGMVGGGETHVFDLSTHLDQNVFEPIVLSFTEGPMVDGLREKGIKTYVIHSKIPFDPRVKKQVKQLLRKEKISLVHAHGSRAASNVMSAAKSLGLPVVYTVHGWSFNDQQRPIIQYLRKKAESYLTKRASQTICVSESNKQTGRMAIKGFECNVINNGISLSKFSSVQNREEIRAQLGFAKEEVWVGFIARLTFQKDPINLLKAIKKAHAKNSNIRLLMVGEGELDEEVSNYIKQKDMESIVKRLPFQSNVPQLLSAIDIYSLVSHWEGLPIGLLEAMAASKAIVASHVDGTKEIIEHQKNGLLIENGESDLLAKSILKLANDSSLRIEYGGRAYDRVKDKFSLEHMVKVTSNLYQSILF